MLTVSDSVTSVHFHVLVDSAGLSVAPQPDLRPSCHLKKLFNIIFLPRPDFLYVLDLGWQCSSSVYFTFSGLTFSPFNLVRFFRLVSVNVLNYNVNPTLNWLFIYKTFFLSKKSEKHKMVI